MLCAVSLPLSCKSDLIVGALMANSPSNRLWHGLSHQYMSLGRSQKSNLFPARLCTMERVANKTKNKAVPSFVAT